MSLFGDFPDDEPVGGRPTRPKASPLDDESNPVRTTSTSLFADDVGDGRNSPWAFPTPKKNSARGSLVKQLLATDVPESYVDAYDDLLQSGARAGNGVSLDAAKELLVSSGLSEGERAKVLGTVLPGGADGGQESLERGEFNVLLALVGLAQEGEDITLDGVDERRRSQFPSNLAIEMLEHH